MSLDNLAPEDKDQAIKERLCSLGLEVDPFSDDRMKGVFFPGGRQDQLEKLFHLAQFGPSVVVVTGVEGIGKTALKNQFLDEAAESALFTLHLQSELLVSNDRILATIAQQLEINRDQIANDSLYDLILDEVEAIHQEQKRCVVVVDDAHLLDKENLDLLYELSFDGVAYNLCLVMFGDETLSNQIADHKWTQFIDEDGHCLQLSPLNELQTGQYLDYRLQVVGVEDIGFTRDEKAQIYAISQGIPTMINRLGRQFLLRTVSNGRVKKYSLPVLHVATIAVIAVVLVFLVYFEQTEDNSNPIAVKEIPLEVKSVAAASPKPPASDSQRKLGISFPADQSNENTEPVQISEIRKAVSAKRVADAKNQTAEGTPVVSKEIKPTSPSVEVKEDEVPELVLTSIDVNRLAPTQAGVSKSQPKKSEPIVVAKATTKKETIKTKPKAAKKTSPYHREDWILGLNAGSYTLQLLGARDEKSVQSFARKYDKNKQMAYYKTWLKGKPWYVVIFGEFDSKEHAQAALVGLPKELRDKKPWTRSLKDIQGVIRRSQS